MWPLTPTDRPPESGLDVRTVGAPRACRRRPARGPCGSNRPHAPASHPSQTPPSRASLHVSSTTPELYDPRQGPQPLRNSASSSEKRAGQTSPAACEGRTCVKGFDGVPLPWEHPPGERAPPPPPPPCFRAPKAPRGAVTSPHQLLSTGPACPLRGSRARPRREEQGRVLTSPPHSGCPHVATAAGDETNPHRSTPSRVLISGYNSLFPDP